MNVETSVRLPESVNVVRVEVPGRPQLRGLPNTRRQKEEVS